MAAQAKELIVDYGPEIGGARKLYDKYLKYSDTVSMTNEEKHKFVQKDRIWKKPDFGKMISEGLSCGLCFFISETRRMLSPKPIDYDDESIREYMDKIAYVRDKAMQIKNNLDARELYLDLNRKGIIWYRYTFINYLAEGEAKGFGLSKLEQKKKWVRESFDLLKYPDELELEAGYDGRYQFRHPINGGARFFRLGEHDSTDFQEGTYVLFQKRVPVLINITKQKGEDFIENIVQNISVDNAEGKKGDGKKAFVPRQLQFVQRNGEDYLGEYYKEKSDAIDTSYGQVSMSFMTDVEVHAKAEDFDAVFGTPSLEFGNWETQKDRQAGLDMAFNAFMDLANVLGIRNEDISLSGTLKLAFGSRGSGNARAHYEPMRQVINLTRPSGAGALCHEWGHALDHYIGKHYSNSPMAYKLGSEDLSQMPKVFKDLVESFKYKEVTQFVDEKDMLKAQMERAKEALDYELAIFRNALKKDALDDWDKAVKNLYENIHTVNPLQYIMMFRNGNGNQWIEDLSKVHKKGTNHVISKNEKLNLSRIGSEFFKRKVAFESAEPKLVKKKVKTDYFRGSERMPYRRQGGYWESPEELFARAFDCFVEDKLREKGLISDYLTYYADDFGAASPRGDERKAFNEKFDKLIAFLKEDGVLHERAGKLFEKEIA